MVPVPPDPEAVALPLLPPLHVTFVGLPIETLTAVAGWVMLATATETQPFASVTVTMYVPALRLEAVAEVAPELQE